jgi:hypothetical protein
MEPRKIIVELLPHERAALLGGNFTSGEVREQLEASASSPHIKPITFTATDVHFLAGDLNHAIVKRGCRDADIIDLSARFDYVHDTINGSLDPWH